MALRIVLGIVIPVFFGDGVRRIREQRCRRQFPLIDRRKIEKRFQGRTATSRFDGGINEAASWVSGRDERPNRAGGVFQDDDGRVTNAQPYRRRKVIAHDSRGEPLQIEIQRRHDGRRGRRVVCALAKPFGDHSREVRGFVGRLKSTDLRRIIQERLRAGVGRQEARLRQTCNISSVAFESCLRILPGVQARGRLWQPARKIASARESSRAGL